MTADDKTKEIARRVRGEIEAAVKSGVASGMTPDEAASKCAGFAFADAYGMNAGEMRRRIFELTCAVAVEARGA